MPSLGYVTIRGETQGMIEGSSEHDRREGLIEIFAFDHEVAVPRKATSALAAGRPVHQEVVITKLVDRSTPKLYQALDQNERLTEVIFEWYEQNGAGAEELTFRIELRGARVTKIRPSMPDFLDPAKDRYRFLEHVSFSYESILWSWGNGSVEFEAVWEEPGA